MQIDMLCSQIAGRESPVEMCSGVYLVDRTVAIWLLFQSRCFHQTGLPGKKFRLQGIFEALVLDAMLGGAFLPREKRGLALPAKFTTIQPQIGFCKVSIGEAFKIPRRLPSIRYKSSSSHYFS